MKPIPIAEKSGLFGKGKHNWHHPDKFKHIRICLECGQTEEGEEFLWFYIWEKVSVKDWEDELCCSRIIWDNQIKKEKEEVIRRAELLEEYNKVLCKKCIRWIMQPGGRYKCNETTLDVSKVFPNCYIPLSDSSDA